MTDHESIIQRLHEAAELIKNLSEENKELSDEIEILTNAGSDLSNVHANLVKKKSIS